MSAKNEYSPKSYTVLGSRQDTSLTGAQPRLDKKIGGSLH
jgi:hypothetical protein